jgi:hypothetical protein
MSSELLLVLISTVAAVASAVGGVFATLAAFRSAGLAKAAIQRSDELEHRRTCSDTIELAQNVSAERTLLVDLLRKLELESKGLASFTGGGGGSWLEGELQRIAKLRSELDSLGQAASGSLGDYKSLLGISEDDLASLSVRLLADLTRLRVLKEGVQDDLANIREQNQFHRERTVRRVPG